LIDATNIGREFEIYSRSNLSPVAKTNLKETIHRVNSPYCLS
jgi:hypothetical protein